MLTVDILKKLPNLTLLINRLNKFGVISDEDQLGLSSTMIEKWNDNCEHFLQDNGYEGGSLLTIGKYFSFCGAIYAIYDSERMDREQAQKHLASAALRHQSN